MPRLSPRMRRFLAECLLGEQAAGNPLTESNQRPGCRSSRSSRLCVLHADEDGKISFISIFTMLAFLLLICLVANSGLLVKQKIELQNAADATAYSTALWQARSLNAVTATNHLMGELTALTVILDGFGGKMLGEGEEKEYGQSTEWNDFLEDQFDNDPWISEQGTIGRFLSDIDKVLVEEVYELLTNDKGKHEAGAMLFDSKITLKFVNSAILVCKQVANVFIEIAAVLEKTPFAAIGYAVEAIAIGMHAYMTSEMIEVGLEWARLQAIELAIEMVNSGGARSGLQQAVIPALSLYADTVVGSSLAGAAGQGGAAFNQAARQTQQELQTAHRLASAESFPAWNRLTLPLAQEPPPLATEQEAPGAELGSWSQPESEWTGNFTDFKLKYIRDRYNALRNVFEDIKRRIGWIAGPLGKAGQLVSDAANLLGIGGGDDSNPFAGEIDKAFKLLEQANKLLDGLPEVPQGSKSPKNPCLIHQDEKLQLPKFYWRAERRTQWVRATYPYVDDMRAPIVRLLSGSNYRYCDAATFYVHWTNRYTLANSYETRREENETSSDSEQGPLDSLRAELAKLRQRLNKLTAPQSDESATLGAGDSLEQISQDLVGLVDQFRDRISTLTEWFANVDDHQNLANSLGRQAAGPPDSGIEPQDAQALGQQLALLNELDRLLNLLDEFLQSLELQEPHMYLMVAANPQNKGLNEPWATSTELAERLFCHLAITTRDPVPLIADRVVYPHASRQPRVAIAQAMVYNANGRGASRNGDPAQLQPDNGWDTLNWAPPVMAYEWGNHEPSRHSMFSVWHFFQPHNIGPRAKVELNWQSKLVPITRPMLQRAAAESDTDLQFFEQFHELVSH